jgi:nitronate monooxygenase
MKTQFTDLFNIKFPIIKSAIDQRSTSALVADVANAGGLGFLCGLMHPTPADLANEIIKTKQLTSKPFGVSLVIPLGEKETNYLAYVQTIIKLNVKVVEISGSNTSVLIKALSHAGIKVIGLCQNVEQALIAQYDGCVSVVVTPDLPTDQSDSDENLQALLQLQQISGALNIPVIAGGLFNQAGALVAAFALGGQAVNMGNLFLSAADISVEDLLNNLVSQASYVIYNKLKPLK